MSKEGWGGGGGPHVKTASLILCWFDECGVVIVDNTLSSNHKSNLYKGRVPEIMRRKTRRVRRIDRWQKFLEFSKRGYIAITASSLCTP